MEHKKYDPAMEKLKPGTKVGIVGESHIWDGPLDQTGRLHASGSSSGITGKQVLKDPVMYAAGPVTLRCCEHKTK